MLLLHSFREASHQSPTSKVSRSWNEPDITYINVNKRLGLSELDLHGEEFVLVSCLGFKFERPSSIRIIYQANCPLQAVPRNFICGIEARYRRLTGGVWNYDGHILQRVASSKLV